MGQHLICPDVSEFQVPLDHTYTRDFVIFRVTFGAHHLDHRFLANANAAKRLYDDGRLAGVLLYVVYTADPVRAQFDAAWKAIGPRVPSWLTGIMIDVETWRGQSYALSGDHSRPLNELYGMHAHRMGNWNSVIAYGNTGDLHTLYPGRDKRCRVIVASYGSDLVYRKVHGAIGQQYTDGQAKYQTPRVDGRRLPRASTPFGHCDHNAFPGVASGKDLVRMLRPEQLHPAPVARPPAGRAPAKRAPAKKVPARAVVAPPAVKAVVAPPAVEAVVTPPAVEAVVAPPALPASLPAADSLVSHNGAHSLVLHDDGTLEIRHRVNTTAIAAPPGRAEEL